MFGSNGRADPEKLMLLLRRGPLQSEVSVAFSCPRLTNLLRNCAERLAIELSTRTFALEVLPPRTGCDDPVSPYESPQEGQHRQSNRGELIVWGPGCVTYEIDGSITIDDIIPRGSREVWNRALENPVCDLQHCLEAEKVGH